MNWFYSVAGAQQGPVDDATFRALVANGTIRPETLVWHDGMPSWQPLSIAAPALASQAATPPPPPQFAPPPYQARPASRIRNIVRDSDFSLAFKTGWQLCTQNFGLVLGLSLVAGLVGMVTCGICLYPLTCGFYIVLIAILRNRNPRPQFGEMFSAGFAKFLPSFVTGLVMGLIVTVINVVLNLVPFLGQLAAIVFYAVGQGLVAWSLLLVADQGATIGEAITLPFKNLGDNRFWMFILINFVAGLVGAAGALLCGIGLLFTIPLSICIIIAAYEQMAGNGGSVPQNPPVAPAPIAPAPPPPGA